MAKQTSTKPVNEIAAQLSMRIDKPNRVVIEKAVNYRCDISQLAFIDAFAEQLGESRKKTLGRLVDAGIDEVLARLDEDTRRQLEARRLENLDELWKEAKEKGAVPDDLGELFKAERGKK
jgi:hypothetical protein